MKTKKDKRRLGNIRILLFRNFLIFTLGLITSILVIYICCQQTEMNSKIAMVCLIIINCVLLITFNVWFLSCKIHRYLEPLKCAIQHYKTDNSVDTGLINYAGPDELVEIISDFHHLTIDLNQILWEKGLIEDGKKKMLADISHDMRAPFTVVLGYLRALQDGLIPEKQKEQYLKVMAEKIEEIMDLLNTFHEYSLIDHPDFPLNLEPTNICHILQDYFSKKYDELELSQFNLKIDIPDTPLYCNIDRKLFNRVLNNIIDNATKYNPPQTTIFISLVVYDNKVQIRIADNGIGIRGEIKDVLFTPFVINNITEKGSGLGISIIHKIVMVHGGTISLAENLSADHGTEYEIELPILI